MFRPILTILGWGKVQSHLYLPACTCIDFPQEDGHNWPQHVGTSLNIYILFYCLLYCNVYYVGCIVKKSWRNVFRRCWIECRLDYRLPRLTLQRFFPTRIPIQECYNFKYNHDWLLTNSQFDYQSSIKVSFNNSHIYSPLTNKYQDRTDHGN